MKTAIVLKDSVTHLRSPEPSDMLKAQSFDWWLRVIIELIRENEASLWLSLAEAFRAVAEPLEAEL